MQDDASLQRGIEDYLTSKTRKYPCYFYPKEVEIPYKTAQAQQEAIAKGEDPKKVAPVCETVDYARISVADICVPDMPVNHEIMQNYAEEFARYKAGQTQQTGTPLDQWGKVDDILRMRLQLYGVHTVEQLLDMGTVERNQIAPGMDMLVHEARKFLGASILQSRKDEQAKKDQEIEELKEQVKQLMALATQKEQPQHQEKRR